MATTLLEYKDNFWGPGSKGFEALVGRVNQDIEATKEIQEFSRCWRQTEEDYANDLIRNVATNPVKSEAGSTGNALVTLAQLLDTGVRTYLEVANIFKDELELPLDEFKKKLRKLKKQIEADYEKVYKQFQKEVFTTERLQKEYATKSKEVALVCEKANRTTGGVSSKKVMASEAELEKIAAEYRAAIEKCDRMQDVYEAKYQEICSAVEAHERERFQLVKTGLEKVVGSQVGKLFHFKEKIYERMVDVVSNINIDEDIQHVIAFAGSGTERPERLRFSETSRQSRSDLFNGLRSSTDVAGDGTKRGSQISDGFQENSPTPEYEPNERSETHEPYQDPATKTFSLRLKRGTHNSRVDVAQRKGVQSSYEGSEKRHNGGEESPRFDLSELKTATLERGKRSLANALSKAIPGRSVFVSGSSSSQPSLRQASRSVDSLATDPSAVPSAGPPGRPDVESRRTSLTTLSHRRTVTAPAQPARPVSHADSSRTLSFTPARGQPGSNLRSEHSIAEGNAASYGTLPYSSSNALSQASLSQGNLRASSAAISPSVSNTSIAQIYRATPPGEQKVIIRSSISEDPGAFDEFLKSVQKKEEANRRKSVHEVNRHGKDSVDTSSAARSRNDLSQNAIPETETVANKSTEDQYDDVSKGISNERASAASLRPSTENNETTAEADSDVESEIPALPDKSKKAGRENARSGSPSNSMDSSRLCPTADASPPISAVAASRTSFDGSESHAYKEGAPTGGSGSGTIMSQDSYASAISELEAEIARSIANPRINPNSSHTNTHTVLLIPEAPLPKVRTNSNTSAKLPLLEKIPTGNERPVPTNQGESPVIPPRTFSPRPIPAPRPNIPKHRLSQWTQNSLPVIDAPIAVAPTTEIPPIAKTPKLDAVASEPNKITLRSSEFTKSSPDLFSSMEHLSEGTLKRKSRQFSPRKSKIQGWVYVCEDNVKSWVHRWTCLEGGYLWFFEQPEDFQKCNKPCGMVAICTPQTSNTVVNTKINVPWNVPDSDNRPFSVSLIVNVNKSLVLSWENEEESNKWVDVLVAETSAARKLAADP